MASRWTTERVLQAAHEWVWIPDDAVRETSADLDVVGYPSYFAMPTQVMRTSSELPFDQLLARARDLAGAWNRDALFWWVRADSRPTDLEDQLLAHGASLVEETDILAIDLLGISAEQPALAAVSIDQLLVQRVSDERTVRDAEMIAAIAFETVPTPESRLPDILTDVEQTWYERTGFRSVAYLDDQPVATGGCTLVGEVARLWGAGVLPQHHGQGAYRSVLLHRLKLARLLGASLALTKGRTNTSGPILRRAGFTRYGVERCYRLTG